MIGGRRNRWAGMNRKASAMWSIGKIFPFWGARYSVFLGISRWSLTVIRERAWWARGRRQGNTSIWQITERFIIETEDASIWNQKFKRCFLGSWRKRGMYLGGNIIPAGVVERVPILRKAAGCLLRPMGITGIWKRGVLAWRGQPERWG